MRSLRKDDFCARIGGEEFAINLKTKDPEVVVKICERILNAIRKSNLVLENEKLSCTLSIGISKSQKQESVDIILNESDQALYKAKHQGKDRYVFFKHI